MKNQNSTRFIKPKKNYDHLLKSPYVKKWVDSYSNGQRNPRLSILNQYCKFLDKTPDDILNEHHQDIKQDNPLNIKNIGTNQILAFYKYLSGEENNINDKMMEKPLSINSARQYAFSKLPSFFRKNNVSITFQKGEVPKEDIDVNDKAWRQGTKRIKDEKKECIKMIKDTFNSLRDKAILLCKISSGMDDCDLFNLRVKNYKRGYYEDVNVSYIVGKRKKSQIYYQTFFNSEACIMLDLYLKERKDKFEEDINDESWLFVSRRALKNGSYKKIKDTAFADALREVCQQLDIQNVTPKSFRRWFSSELKKNRVDFEIVERMMGHKVIIGQKYSQILNDTDMFLDHYIEEIEPHTLLGNGGNKKFSEMDKKVEKLETENKYLKNTLEDLREVLIELVKDDKRLIEKLTKSEVKDQ